MIVNNKHIVLLIATVILYAFLLNEYNNYEIRKIEKDNHLVSNKSLIYNASVYSIDNSWYTIQIKNHVNGKGFTINPDDHHSYIRRTPVYPVFYGFHYLLFGEKNSYFFIRFTQIFIFGFATIALLFGAYNFTNNKTIAIASALLYGFNPTLVAYLYFTITEALSPSLICFFIYFLSCAYQYNRSKDWFWSGLFFALAILCRPAIVLIGPALLFLICYKNYQKLSIFLNRSLFFIIGTSLLMLPHIIRNYYNTKEIVLLEKYYGDPMDYGMPNIALRNWIAGWMNPADYTSETVSNNMIRNIKNNHIDKATFLQSELKKIPLSAFDYNNKDSVAAAYSYLYDFYLEKNKKSVSVDSVANISIVAFQKLKTDYIKNAPLHYFVITPLLFIKSLVLQSNSGQSVYLQNYQNNKLIFLLKLFLYCFNIYLFGALFICFFYRKKYAAIYGITILFVATTCIYIIFFLHYFEARYLIPLFPFMYIIGAIVGVEIFNSIRQKIN